MECPFLCDNKARTENHERENMELQRERAVAVRACEQ